MKYEEKLNRMATHMEDHPHDYQTSISYLKLRSKAIAGERKQKKLEAWKKVQKYKEQEHGK
ncbi:hypothetical protein [uncultured Dubosiella sp.]|uniref:hypothetical protein n=1 Tax=uncultured Dubosiella sp. TaxID=1937011 RepID=UPI00262AF2DB|nr:hypothetical protein [uncultured Dubosiella sp.]